MDGYVILPGWSRWYLRTISDTTSAAGSPSAPTVVLHARHRAVRVDFHDDTRPHDVGEAPLELRHTEREVIAPSPPSGSNCLSHTNRVTPASTVSSSRGSRSRRRPGGTRGVVHRQSTPLWNVPSPRGCGRAVSCPFHRPPRPARRRPARRDRPLRRGPLPHGPACRGCLPRRTALERPHVRGREAHPLCQQALHGRPRLRAAGTGSGSDSPSGRGTCRERATSGRNQGRRPNFRDHRGPLSAPSPASGGPGRGSSG